MSKSRRRVRVTGAHEAMGDAANVSVSRGDSDVTIVVTRAFGPSGENLVGLSDVSFDGYPAVTVLVRASDREGLVHLSPIHGDDRKAGFTDFEPGTICELLCPVSKQPLDRLSDVPGNPDAGYYALYLTPQLSEGSLVAVSNVWDHYQSRIVDNFELISAWASEEESA